MTNAHVVVPDDSIVILGLELFDSMTASSRMGDIFDVRLSFNQHHQNAFVLLVTSVCGNPFKLNMLLLCGCVFVYCLWKPFIIFHVVTKLYCKWLLQLYVAIVFHVYYKMLCCGSMYVGMHTYSLFRRGHSSLPYTSAEALKSICHLLYSFISLNYSRPLLKSRLAWLPKPPLYMGFTGHSMYVT